MTERPKRVSKQERYTYSWYLPSQKSDRPNVELELRNPEGDFAEEPEVAEDSSLMMGIESTNGGSSTVKDFEMHVLSRSGSRGIYRPKHYSSGMKSSLSEKLHLRGGLRVRIGVEAAWGALAGAGAVSLLTRAGTLPVPQLAELGAVWGGIAAFLWIILGKLSG